jgi:hypothetical protein
VSGFSIDPFGVKVVFDETVPRGMFEIRGNDLHIHPEDESLLRSLIDDADGERSFAE